MGFRFSNRSLLVIAVIGAAILVGSAPASAGTLVEGTSEVFGTFGDVEFLRHTGRFQGVTSLGAFDVPFEIVAPADPGHGNGTVLFEPPHFFFGPWMRDALLGPNLVLGGGFSYAAVGFGTNGLNVLDPTAAEILVAGEVVESPGVLDPTGVLDEEIIVQFVQAIGSEPLATELLGELTGVYSTGVSQTGAILLETLRVPEGQELFDFTLLYVTLWAPIFDPEMEPFQRLEGEYEPLPEAGRVVFVASEGDQLFSESEQLRNAVPLPNYRLYEVAGTAHLPLPPPFNPLDPAPVARAAFVAGDRWVRSGVEPPLSTTFEVGSGIDPVYGSETGIARDENLNALGGVRLPEVEVGQALYVASLLDFEILPGLPGLVGTIFDLACEPHPDGSIRFESHGDYVSRFVDQANILVAQGFLLPADAEAMKERAAESEIGKPGSCEEEATSIAEASAPVASNGIGAEGGLPFELSAEGQLTVIPPFQPGSDPRCNANLTPDGDHPGAFVTILDIGTGVGSHLGHFSFEATSCLDPVTGDAPGWGTMTAADGDEIFIEFFNRPAPAPEGFAGFAGPQEVVGGTGRFEGATGEQDCRGLVDNSDLSVEFECSGNLVIQPGSVGLD